MGNLQGGSNVPYPHFNTSHTDCNASSRYCRTDHLWRFYVDTRASDTKVTKTFSDGTVETTKTPARPQLYDNGSRIGIRGSEKVSDNLDFLYRLEYRSPIDSDHRSLEPRDAWIGVKHKDLGTLKAGRLLSPEPYIRYTWSYPTWGADGNRSNNAVRYESPTWNDTSFMVHYVMDENNKDADSKTDSLHTDGVGVLAKHQTDKYGLGAAYFHADSQKAIHGVKIKNQLRVTGFYNVDDKNQVNFIYQNNRFNDTHYGEPSKHNQGIGIGAHHKLDDKNTIYAHIDYAKNPYGKDGTFKQYTIAADRKVGQKLIVGAEAGYYKETINAPAHEQTLAHKQETSSAGVILFSAYTF